MYFNFQLLNDVMGSENDSGPFWIGSTFGSFPVTFSHTLFEQLYILSVLAQLSSLNEDKSLAVFSLHHPLLLSD